MKRPTIAAAIFATLIGAAIAAKIAAAMVGRFIVFPCDYFVFELSA